MNPYGLTEKQASAMDAMCRLGCAKAVANELNVYYTTVHYYVRKAQEAMHVKTPILAVLEWDRVRRGGNV